MPVRILIVDDRKENHESLKAVFEGENYKFAHALSGEEALKILLADTSFTLIILDVLMPEMDGFETAAYITRRDSLRHIPIIFLTAKDTQDQIFKAFDIGAVDYLSKPIVPEILKAKVNVFVELSKKNRALEVQQQKLKRVNDELSVEIKEREASEAKVRLLNNQLSNRLKELEALDAFSYSVAHDFKTPLNNISMIAHILKRNEEINASKEAIDHVNKIDGQVSLLSNLVDDLLIFSRDDVIIKKQMVDMSELVGIVIDELKFSTSENERHEVSVDPLPKVYCNIGLLKQVWMNLLSNAFKYSSNEESPKISINYQKEDNMNVFTVCDNGVGFNESESKNLFKAFNRLNSGKKFNGSGIGLVLVKRIIEKHGGQIWAESEPGSTKFSFCLSEETKRSSIKYV